MQSIILAAGMGSRLGKHTRENTKCMLKINGKPLIEHALNALKAVGIRKVVLVVGYRRDNLKAFVGERFGGIEIEYVVNEVYNKTNNIYSLYLARHHLSVDDTLLLESDLIFEERILRRLLDDPREDLAVVDQYRSWMDGTAVKLDNDDAIAVFVPKRAFDFREVESYFKTVNIYKFSKGFSENVYIPFLEAYCSALGHNEYYEQVLGVIATLENCNLKGCRLKDEKWYEIDDAQDLDNAETIFAQTPAERLQRLQRRYGGYWRFPRVKDFCYLVNPYFPTRRFEQELQANFRHLLCEYPSGQNVQNLLAAKMFQVEEEEILVGNGASELIRGLATAIDGRFGMVFPTFNEYPNSLGYDRVERLIPDNPQFRYSVDELRELARHCDNILLINPDTPTGHYIPKSEVLVLARELNQMGKRLIVDESFVDFSDTGPGESLLHSELLTDFDNLVVIKSISKSYGVPGLRLGVVASTDRQLLERIRAEISIWNVNSFAEFFLQIIGKYGADYRTACARMAEERNWLFKELGKIAWMEPFPSEANYFLCRVDGEHNATQLAERLLDRHDIFIKDLTGKIGFPDERYVRIAVRDRQDNQQLIDALLNL